MFEMTMPLLGREGGNVEAGMVQRYGRRGMFSEFPVLKLGILGFSTMRSRV